MSAIKIFEQDYIKDPFINIKNKTPTYNKRQRILFQIIRFYYGLLIKDETTIKEIELSSRGFFENPIELSTRFGSDLFLGIKNYLEIYQPTNMNALGKKAKELLGLIDSKIIEKRESELAQIMAESF